MKLITCLIAFFGFFIIVMSCDGDVIEPASGCDILETSYDANIKDIIDQTCSYSGCHDGSGGIGPGNYNSYEGLLRDLESGSFTARVITQRDNPSLGMPPDKAVYPQSQQDSLSAIQLEIITCWLQSGFPEQ